MTTSNIIKSLKKFVTWSEDNYVAEELLLLIKDIEEHALGRIGIKARVQLLANQSEDRFMMETLNDFNATI